MRFEHEPVMAREALELLDVEGGGWFLDATVGGGGHAALILESNPHTMLVALDQDPEAVEAARRRLDPYGERARVVEANFRDAARLTELDIDIDLDGALMDLGVSSHQIDTTARGFWRWNSFRVKISPSGSNAVPSRSKTRYAWRHRSPRRSRPPTSAASSIAISSRPMCG